ncbi:MAG: hypothetical protein FD154_2501 [Elusimicrobia bacterium]|nr:MAG: hypothetical protein FD154_2501 [Elusimicrobiota bacterium]
MKTLVAAVILTALALGACEKKRPENIPQPKADQAQTAAVSTAPAVDQNPLTAPGSYLKSTVGQIDKAKAAAALYEKSAAESAKSLDFNDTGGN